MISDELLDWENGHNVLDFKFQHDSVLVWPLIRDTVFNKIIDNACQLQPAHAGRGKINLNKKIAYFYRTFKGNPLAIKRDFPLLFITSTAGICIETNGKWLGRISDYFVLEYNDQSLVLDKSSRLEYKFPRLPGNVRSYDYISLCSTIDSKLFGQAPPEDGEIIKGLMALLRESWSQRLKDPDYFEIERILRLFNSRLNSLHKYYLKLFNKVKPRVLFIEEGSYGGVNSWIIKWAKDCGLVTCEPQHGCIGLPYIYGNRLRNNAEYKKYLPDHLLLYGPYWAGLVRSPSKPVVIGNPHFDAQKQGITDVKKDDRAKTVLIVSQGTVTNVLVDLALQLSRLFKGENNKIIFRLHWGEVPFVDRYQKLQGIQNIQIDKDQNIYRLICDSDYIVGSYSLTLFEAAGFNKKIYVLEGDQSMEYIPQDLGVRFKNARELFGLIKSDTCPPTGSGRAFWATDWRKNYRDFINSILVNEGVR